MPSTHNSSNRSPLGRPLRLVLDTNIVIDFLNARAPFFEPARLLMALGKLGEVHLWMAASQFTDVIYVVSNGGAVSLLPSALERLRCLRTFIQVAPIIDQSVDSMLATQWKDPEDALLYEIARNLHADALITRNGNDFKEEVRKESADATLKICDCEELFDWMQSELGFSYDFIEFP